MPLGDTNAGGPNPALLQLLFQRMEQRRQAEIDAGKQNFEAMAALAEERRKAQDHDLKIAERRFKIAQERDKFLADLSGRADAAAESSSERIGQTASQIADQAIQGPAGPELPLPQGVQGPLQPAAGALSNESEMIRGQEFGPIARDIQRAGETLAPVFGTDPMTESQNVAEQVGLQGTSQARDRRMARENKRKELRQQKQIEEEFQLRSEAREAERKASQRGQWKGSEIDARRKEVKADLKFLPGLVKDRRVVDQLDSRDPTDILEALQRYQRRVDEGATVREGDVALLRWAGVTTGEEFLAKMRGIYDRTGKFPGDFGDTLIENLNRIYDEEERLALEIHSNATDFAERQGWSERQRNRAFPYPELIERVRDRRIERAADQMRTEDAVFSAPSRDEFDRMGSIIANQMGVPIEEVPAETIVNAIVNLRGASQGAQ